MEVTTVAVVGLGFLGRGIVTCLLANGFRVVGCDTSEDSLRTTRPDIEGGLKELVSHGRLRSEDVDHRLSSYQEATQFTPLAECNFVIESVFEGVEEKSAAYDQIEAQVRPDVPIASNTSSISVTRLQAGRQHPSRFLGMHWAEPAYATRFLELIPGEKTAAETMTIATALAHRCGKDPSVLKKDVPGFLVNRLAYALYREACHLVETGVADVETIDRSFRNTLGVWSTVCGPFQWMDLTGGPALYANAMQNVLPTLATDCNVPEPARSLAARDAKGVTNGDGFYSYTPAQAEAARERFHKHTWAAQAMLNDYFPLEQR